ncbi:MAG: S9 family peptidase [Acidobacteria bacterium]|nr:S9 family peptidase [Acidobacteriota bacterium]
MTPARRPLRIFAAAVLLALVAPASPRGAAEEHPAYPDAPKISQIDDYHGTKVADPYRCLEDLDSAQTKAWVEAENKVTFAFLDQIPERPQIKQRLTKLWNYERYGIDFKQGGRYFHTKNDGLQNQSVWYWQPSLTVEPKILLDPNKLSADGTVALDGLSISEDAKLAAYSIQTSGSDWREWKVRNVDTGEDLPDLIRWSKFSGAAWTHDGKGFFYSRYDEPAAGTKMVGANYFQKLYYHRIGNPQETDALVYERKDHKEWGLGGQVTDDGRYLAINVSEGTDPKNRFFYKDLAEKDSKVVELLVDFDASYNFIDNDGPVFWFLTDLKAPRGRIIAIDTRNPARDNWKEIVPESKDTLRSVNALNNSFVATYLKDAHSAVKVFSLDGKFVREVALPGIGSANGFGGRRSDTETFYSFAGYTQPTTIYRYDPVADRSTVYRKPIVDFDPNEYETQQVFYNSKDGTRVPMFITGKKGYRLDGSNPTYLYGYGGFDIPLTPAFSASQLVWMEMGGLVAIANLRGGGEYGEEWHLAGTKLHKQNVFDDFIAAGEWLVANKYTSTPKLAIAGGSNGGLLIGACLNQRPDLFGAALPAVGVMDMLRFHKFTIGWAWASDYGNADDPDQFKAIYAYSPLHNIKPGTKYPATLVTTADHDDRVVPAHSFKYAATLQAAQGGDAPILIRVETKAGHGSGKPTAKIIEEAADAWSFLVRELKVDVPAAR